MHAHSNIVKLILLKHSQADAAGDEKKGKKEKKEKKAKAAPAPAVKAPASITALDIRVGEVGAQQTLKSPICAPSV